LSINIAEDELKIFTPKPRLTAGVFDINLSQEQKHYIMIVVRECEKQENRTIHWLGLLAGVISGW